MTTTLQRVKLDDVVTRMHGHGVLSRIHTHGLDEASRHLEPFLQVRYVQLERGTACVDGAVARLDRMTVGRCGADRGKVEWLDVPRGRMLIVMPVRGRARLDAACVVPGHAIVANGPTRLVIFTDRDYQALFVSMPDFRAESLADEGHADARSPAGTSRVRLMNVSEPRTRVLQRCIQRVLDEVPAGNASGLTLSFTAAEKILLHVCGTWWREPRSHDPAICTATARCYAAVRARQYIDEHLDQPLSLASVCHASYSSPRALEYGFREIFGVSPNKYIRCSRLSNVRRELHCEPQAQGRITQLAMKWGFWHLSQFAKDYYELFGELPSTTLGRATGRLARAACGNGDCTATARLDAVSDRVE